MTFVQLEYIIALDVHRHFAVAAEHCHVTQPTLSMQINKLEQELGLKLFDRSKQPVLPTEAGIEVIAKDIDPNKLWLLEEGHCFRSQIVNLCELRRKTREGSHFEYEAGSIETLRRMVELNDGVTIIPELATIDMSSRQQQHLRYFKSPAPVREVSMVVHRHFVKKKLIEILKQEVLKVIPEKIRKIKKAGVLPRELN